MSFEGSLLVVGLREVLQHLEEERGTGILTLQNEREILAVTFQRGEVVGADSLAEGEGALGSLLARERLVEPQEFAAVVAAQRTGGGRIADLLLERGVIERPALLGALRRHTLRLVLDVLSWRDGSYKFYAGEEVSFEEGFDPISIEELLSMAPADAGLRGEPTLGRPGATRTPTPVPGALRGLEALPDLGPQAGPSAAAVSASGVFVPPAPGRPAEPAPRVAVLAAGAAGRARRWRWATVLSIGASLGTLLALALWFAARPAALMVSVPWSPLVRQEFEASRRMAVFEQIDAAARAYYFIHGSYPDDLDGLVQAGLLSAASAARGPAGSRLRFTSNGPIYALESASGNDGSRSFGAVESVAGDLFLDTSLFDREADNQESPLVLLD